MTFRAETTGNAGADLSALQYRFVYLDSSDSDNVKQLTSVYLVKEAYGVLQNKPTDDSRADVRIAGFATVEAGGAITPGAYVINDSVGRAIADTGNGVIRGLYVPSRANKDAASGDYVRILLLPPKPGLQVATGSYDFASDGGAAGAISLLTTIPSGAVIHTATLDTETTATSATGPDNGTGALAIGGVTLDAAIAINDAGNPWDAGQRALDVPGQTTTAAALTLTIATDDWTAGKFNVHILYSYNP